MTRKRKMQRYSVGPRVRAWLCPSCYLAPVNEDDLAPDEGIRETDPDIPHEPREVVVLSHSEYLKHHSHRT